MVLIMDAAVVLGSLICFNNWVKKEKDLVYSEVYVEIGEETPDVSEFLKREEKDVAFSADSKIDMKAVGDYNLTVLWQMPILGEQSFPTVLHVIDTTPPTVVPVSEVTYFDYDKKKKEPMIFLESVSDYTDYTAEFAGDYDFTKPGKFDIKIVVSDTSGNETEVSIPCTILHDETPPEITGVRPITVHTGETISYTNGITVTDDYDKDPELEVDTSRVNTDKSGNYTVTYTATDDAGNTSSQTAPVTIILARDSAATEESVNALADAVLKDIIEDDMTKKEKAKKIYNWVVDSIAYSYSTGYDDKLSGAYAGFTNLRGDCTVMQKTTEVLLNRVGIPTVEIEKIRDNHGGHSWLLVDLGEGWYHLDPTRMDDGSLIFCWSDEKLKEFNRTDSMNHHNFDRSRYPAIQ